MANSDRIETYIPSARSLYSLASAGLAGLAIGIYITVLLADPVSLIGERAEWVATAEAVHYMAAVGAAIAAIGWIYTDWRGGVKQ